jgi:hypothetical protein
VWRNTFSVGHFTIVQKFPHIHIRWLFWNGKCPRSGGVSESKSEEQCWYGVTRQKCMGIFHLWGKISLKWIISCTEPTVTASALVEGFIRPDPSYPVSPGSWTSAMPCWDTGIILTHSCVSSTLAQFH